MWLSVRTRNDVTFHDLDRDRRGLFISAIDELPHLTFEEGQILIRVVELDDPALSPTGEALIDERLAEHHFRSGFFGEFESL